MRTKPSVSSTIPNCFPKNVGFKRIHTFLLENAENNQLRICNNLWSFNSSNWSKCCVAWALWTPRYWNERLFAPLFAGVGFLKDWATSNTMECLKMSLIIGWSGRWLGAGILTWPWEVANILPLKHLFDPGGLESNQSVYWILLQKKFNYIPSRHATG